MGIIVNSPHSGNPVKVRDQDVGRAVRDEAGRIFYVLPRSDGKGCYGAITRAGSAREEARAMELEEKLGANRAHVHEQVARVHDATGRKRSNVRGKLVILVLILLLLALGYVAYTTMWGKWTKGPPGNQVPLDRGPATPTQPVPSPADTPSSDLAAPAPALSGGATPRAPFRLTVAVTLTAFPVARMSARAA